jgi:hypothetical protein
LCTLQVAIRTQSQLKVAGPVMAQTRHVPGEAGHEIDLFRVGLEVDEELGPLWRTEAGEILQRW